MKQKNFYFTFGTSSIFPYHSGYLIVKANNLFEACKKFRDKYPDKSPNCLCCAFYYDQHEWDEITVDMGECHEVIE